MTPFAFIAGATPDQWSGFLRRVEARLLPAYAPLGPAETRHYVRREWSRRHAGPERRYYYRAFDFNSDPGWMDVRRRAESHLDALAPWFDRDAVRRLLPVPPARVEVPDAISDTAGRKSLLGLAIWLGRHQAHPAA